MLALPVETLKLVIANPNVNMAANTDADAQRFFRVLFADRAGPLPEALTLLGIHNR